MIRSTRSAAHGLGSAMCPSLSWRNTKESLHQRDPTRQGGNIDGPGRCGGGDQMAVSSDDVDPAARESSSRAVRAAAFSTGRTWTRDAFE